VKRILVVDDEPEIGALVALCLDQLNVEVIEADGLDGALRLARDEPIDLVLLDLALGREDGMRLLPRFREEPRLSGIPIVAFSAHDSRKREALSSGFDSFLSRPFAAQDLEDTVKKYLEPS
jgi:two-component system cell cycle response regulator DivK